MGFKISEMLDPCRIMYSARGEKCPSPQETHILGLNVYFLSDFHANKTGWMVRTTDKYFVTLPLFSTTACSLLGIDSTKAFRQSQLSILVTHSLLVSACSWGMDVTFLSWSWSFIQLRAFSMGFRSGKFPCQSISVMWGHCWNHPSQSSGRYIANCDSPILFCLPSD